MKLTSEDLKQYRKVNKLNQTEMARLIGIGLRQYQKYEQNADDIPDKNVNFIRMILDNKINLDTEGNLVLEESSEKYGKELPTNFNSVDEMVVFIDQNYKELVKNPVFKMMMRNKIYEGYIHFDKNGKLPEELE